MIEVSDAFKEAFNQGTQKNLTLRFSNGITLENENIVAESMTLDQILCDNQQLTFGLCSAASFKVRTFYVASSRVGQTVIPTITAHKDAEDYSMQLGVFKIATDKATDDRMYRDITAYDCLYDIVNNDYRAWYESLTFPMTLREYRYAFFNYLGIQQEEADLINDSMIIEKTVDVDIYSGKNVLKHILEINAVCGYINNQNHFQYIPFANEGGLYPDEDIFPADDLYPEDGYDVFVNGGTYSYIQGSHVYEDYIFKKIKGLLISEGKDGEEYFFGEQGSLYNTYNISGNYLLFGKTQEDLEIVANNFLEFVENFIYNPAKIKLRGMPWVELGDIIGVVGKRATSTFPILRRTLSGITALYDVYEGKGVEYLTYSSNSASKVSEKMRSKTQALSDKVDGYDEVFDEIIEEIDSQGDQIDQLTDAVATKVGKSSVISDINATSETARINESKLNIDSVKTVTRETLTVETYGGTVLCEKCNNIVTLTGNDIGSTSAITSEVTIATLSSGFRPSATFNTVGFSGSNFLTFTVGDNGEIKTSNTSNGSFKVTYIV